ncbi:hypothetical protein PMAYCL1PPCAC_27391, partial [Pristionchus mayeri]
SNISVTMASIRPTQTNLQSHLARGRLYSFVRRFMSTPADAVGPVLYAVADAEMEGETGVTIDPMRGVTREWGENVE